LNWGVEELVQGYPQGGCLYTILYECLSSLGVATLLPGASRPPTLVASIHESPRETEKSRGLIQLEEAHEANRENRRIIAGLVQRVPDLEPAREQRESTVSAFEERDGDEVPLESEKRSFWQKLFGT
jgi:hypothetical protein